VSSGDNAAVDDPLIAAWDLQAQVAGQTVWRGGPYDDNHTSVLSTEDPKAAAAELLSY